jgi:hypothetical protein
MKSQLLSVLTVVGVLGTASAALAVNTDAVTNLDAGLVDTSSPAIVPETSSPDTQSALTPEATPASPTDPAAPVTISPDGTISNAGVKQPAAQQSFDGTAPAAPVTPVVAAPAAPAPVDATTGGSGAASGSDDDDDDDDDSSYEDHDDEDDEDDD